MKIWVIRGHEQGVEIMCDSQGVGTTFDDALRSFVEDCSQVEGKYDFWRPAIAAISHKHTDDPDGIQHWAAVVIPESPDHNEARLQIEASRFVI